MDLTDRFREALNYSLDLKSYSFCKGTQTSCVAHLLAVAAIVLEYGGDEDQAIADLLHEA
jgi:(p)ppGpp synthase/HD superfamily hydrolase